MLIPFPLLKRAVGWPAISYIAKSCILPRELCDYRLEQYMFACRFLDVFVVRELRLTVLVA